ncbi:MAG: N-acetyltransferase [Thermodesulfobacteriota bacterium]
MIRKAAVNDIEIIYHLLNKFAEKGYLLSRPLSKLYDNIRNFSVYVNGGTQEVVGCCALAVCWKDLAEIRSLAIRPDCWGRGYGKQLVENALAEARSFDIKKVFVLTYKVDFFASFGFSVIDKSELPIKIWSDCITCVKFPDCDETAMVKNLS